MKWVEEILRKLMKKVWFIPRLLSWKSRSRVACGRPYLGEAAQLTIPLVIPSYPVVI